MDQQTKISVAVAVAVFVVGLTVITMAWTPWAPSTPAAEAPTATATGLATREATSTLPPTAIPSVTLEDQVITVPLENNVMAFSMYGGTFEEVDDCEYPGQKTEALQTVVDTEDYGSYKIRRSFLEFKIPQNVEVISASVNGAIASSWHGYSEPLPAPTLSIHPGTWSGDMWGIPQGQIWGAFEREQVVGRYDTAPIYTPPDNSSMTEYTRVHIPLDVSHFVPGETNRFVFRDSEDHLDLSGKDGDSRNVIFKERKSWIKLTVEEVDGGK
jgi:hypothetical protein